MDLHRAIRFATIALLLLTFSTRASDTPGWWPPQAFPKGLIRAGIPSTSVSNWTTLCMMVQSISGLAAKAVSEGRADELVWVETANIDEEDWLARLQTKHPELEMRGALDPWPLVDRYVQKGIIKGYILCHYNDSSVNVATSLAGILDGIIVDESLQSQAQQHGLKMLIDVRGKTPAWCFETYKDRFTRNLVCIQPPGKPHVRDLAIAHKAFTFHGDEAPASKVMSWLEPLSPILGWNVGDEFQSTALSSRWGHIQTATDWCSNLPVLMAGTSNAPQSRITNLDPRKIDWNDPRSGVSFITTDGDNVQWFEGNFFRSVQDPGYWRDPNRGKIPFGWSCCFAQLSQLCPEAIDYAITTQTTNDSFIEWGGGYYYPDLFAVGRTNRWDLLAQHAQRTWALMQKNNTRIIGFNVSKLDSRDALKAYQTIASQCDGLLGILVFQYDAYEAGAGKVFWVKDRNGIELPVVSARYSIWNHLNNRPRAGTPAKIAREIKDTVTKSQSTPRYDWVIDHVWSYFKPAPGSDENAEDMPQEPRATVLAQGGQRGYAPALWCAQRLPSNIRTISPEELLWRIRMQHDPAQTQKLIQQWTP